MLKEISPTARIISTLSIISIILMGIVINNPREKQKAKELIVNNSFEAAALLAASTCVITDTTIPVNYNKSLYSEYTHNFNEVALRALNDLGILYLGNGTEYSERFNVTDLLLLLPRLKFPNHEINNDGPYGISILCSNKEPIYFWAKDLNIRFLTKIMTYLYDLGISEHRITMIGSKSYNVLGNI